MSTKKAKYILNKEEVSHAQMKKFVDEADDMDIAMKVGNLTKSAFTAQMTQYIQAPLPQAHLPLGIYALKWRAN